MKGRPRLLFVGNFLLRHWGAGRTGIDMRLEAAALRLNLPCMAFSERDIARFLAPMGFMRRTGAAMMNSRLVKTVRNFRPDVVFISHCDYVTNSAIAKMREARPGVRIVHLNCDSPSTEHCRRQLSRRRDSCDAIFSTSAGEMLKAWTTGRNIVGYFPNPSDPAFEIEDNSSKTSFKYDLFFAGRPELADTRLKLLRRLRERVAPDVRLGFFGMDDAPLVVGRDYEEAIASSKMGLSLNRFEGGRWYESDRITHLMGNGLLTFAYDGNGMQDFFSEKELILCHTAEELADKVSFYNAHDDSRRAIAGAGRAKYHALFDARRVLSYLLETVLGEDYSQSYEWASEVYR